MERITLRKLGSWILFLALVVVLLSGCGSQTSAEAETGDSGYTGTLDTTYENALDVTSQLALGTLNLEGTAYAVTKEQAAKLLPLWQALGGSALQGNAERNAVVRQIETTMTGAQVSAIVAMRLAQEDAQAWVQSQGGGAAARRGQAPGGSSRGVIGAVIARLAERGGVAVAQAVEPTATTPTTLPSPTHTPGDASGPNAALDPTSAPESTPTIEPTGTPEVPAAAEAAPTPTAEPTSGAEFPAAPEPTPPATPTLTPSATPPPMPEPVVYVVQAGDSLAAIARLHGVSLATIMEANGIQDPNLIYVGQKLILPGATRDSTTSTSPSSGEKTESTDSRPSPPAQVSTATSAWISGALERLRDTDPGPPFTVEVSANRATQDPLVEKSQLYQVAGIVRNDGDQTYAVSTIHVTFFDAEGFRGSFHRYPGRGRTGGEWVWHGRTQADFACMLLAPGESCPFIAEIGAQDMAAFLVHPDAVPTDRESAPVELSNLSLAHDSTSFVRITGTATNKNAFKVKNVTVSGVLIDDSGQIVSMGSTYVLKEDILPDASVQFDVRIGYEPFDSYRLYAQAERDWE